MAPEDDVIAWAEGLLRKYPGLPTIISIHDHLNVAGERKAIPAVDFDAVHAEHNDPEERSEEHTSELQSLMRISYAVFCLQKKKFIIMMYSSHSLDNSMLPVQ